MGPLDIGLLKSIKDHIWAKPCHAYCAYERIQAKLKRSKQFFKGWGFNRQGEQRKMKAALQKELLSLETMEEV